MKRMNNVVVGAFVFALLMAFGSPSFGALPISEEFDGPEYAFTFENFQPEEAAFTVSQDTNSVLSGVNSAKLNITSSGTEWWAIQVRATEQVYATSILSVSFDIKSSAAIDCIFRIEGANPTPAQDFDISLAAGETKHYAFLSDKIGYGGPANFMFAFGNSLGVVADVWIDNVQIEVVSMDFLHMPVVEEFDSAPEGRFFGVFSFENYPGEPVSAIYTFSQDTSSVLSGTNSAYMNITSSGSEWWMIQVRLENLIIETNTIVDVSFDIKSTAEITFTSRLEGAGNEPEDEIVTVLAGETKTVNYQTGTLTNANISTFLLAMGASTTGAAEVWIDNVILRKWAAVPEIGDITINPLSDGNVALTWDTAEFYDYALETKETLQQVNWTTNQIVSGVGGSVTATATVEQVQSFYRVTAE